MIDRVFWVGGLVQDLLHLALDVLLLALLARLLRTLRR